MLAVENNLKQKQKSSINENSSTKRDLEPVKAKELRKVSAIFKSRSPSNDITNA